LSHTLSQMTSLGFRIVLEKKKVPTGYALGLFPP